MKINIKYEKLTDSVDYMCVIYIDEKHVAFCVRREQTQDLQFFFDHLFTPSMQYLLDTQFSQGSDSGCHGKGDTPET